MTTDRITNPFVSYEIIRALYTTSELSMTPGEVCVHLAEYGIHATYQDVRDHLIHLWGENLISVDPYISRGAKICYRAAYAI